MIKHALAFFPTLICNALACGMQDLCAAPAAGPLRVERDQSGVPVAWRLFAFGPVSITRDGETLQGEFTEAAADSIMQHFAQKGGKIPLDSRHFLFMLAQEMGVDESEVLRLLPDGRGTFGFAALEKRPDGLWVVAVEYVPLARRLMAEGIFRYFSPVLRGLADGRLRITSVAFTNNPAIDQLDALAAEGETEPAVYDIDALAASLDAVSAASANRSSKPQPKGHHPMTKLLAALASLLGLDSLALGDDGTAPDGLADQIATLAGEHNRLKAQETAQKSFLAGVRDALALGDGSSLETAQAAILGLRAAADQAGSLKTRVDALELEAESRRRQEVVDRGLAAGKLTKAMLDSAWLKGQDAAALSAYLDFAPVVCPPGRLDRATLATPDAVALSASELNIASLLGISPEAMLATKKGAAAAQK
jgi:phage I-like protein